MAQLFTTILYQPILNLLVGLYNIIPGNDLGVAIIILTVIIKLILYPFSKQAIKGQKSMQDLQPKIEAVKQQYKNDREAQAKALMALYKQEKVNPLSSCLPLLIQLPLLIAVYQVFIHAIPAQSFDLLYPFVANPGQLNPISLGFIDLAKPNLVLAVLAGAAQFWQTKMLTTKKPPKNIQNKPGVKDESMMATMNKQMLFMMPLLTVFIGARFPGGLALYWFVLTLLTALQQLWTFRHKPTAVPAVIEGEKVNK